jgi:hypothetical protein
MTHGPHFVESDRTKQRRRGVDDLTKVGAGQRCRPDVETLPDVADTGDPNGTGARPLRSVLIGALAVGGAVLVLYPLAFLLMIGYVLGCFFASPMLARGASSSVGWALTITVVVAAFAMGAVTLPKIVARHNDAHPTKPLDLVRFKRVLLAAQPFILVVATYLTIVAAATPPAFLDEPIWKFVSPLRFVWLFVSMEAAAIVVSWFVSRRDLRRWQIALRASTSFLILVCLLPIGSTQTCDDPIFDEAIYPLPTSMTVLSDEQQEGGTSHDPPHVRSLVLQHVGQSASQTARELQAHLAGRGWPMYDYSSSRGISLSSGDGNRWHLSVRTETYGTSLKAPDAVYVQLDRENDGAFCLD